MAYESILENAVWGARFDKRYMTGCGSGQTWEIATTDNAKDNYQVQINPHYQSLEDAR